MTSSTSAMPHCPFSALAVGAAVARAAAVVHVGDREPAARPVLDLQVERRPGRRRRAAVADDDERRPLAGGRGEVLVARRVVERVRRAPPAVGNSIASRDRDIAGVDLQRRATRSVSTAPDARSTRTTASGCVAEPAISTACVSFAAIQSCGMICGARSVSAPRRDVDRRQVPAAPLRVYDTTSRDGPAKAHVDVPNTHCGLPNSARRSDRSRRSIDGSRPFVAR